jgi:beta-glucanase (GH16 family)
MRHLAALACILALGAGTALADGVAPPSGYTLVWADEFDGVGLPDPGKWVYDTEANATGWYNNELQYYAVRRPEITSLDQGILSINARKERLTSEPDYGGQAYSSARLITRGKADWTYGYFEIRARLPCGLGTWPAFWMLGPQDIPWPNNGEIDIMEQVGSAPDQIHATIHTAATAGTFGIGESLTLADACTNFHTYHMLWTADKIIIGVDGEDYFTFENDGTGTASWPYDTPHYLLINLAIGGDMAGPVDDTIFPVTLRVDYVRVYQRAD